MNSNTNVASMFLDSIEPGFSANKHRFWANKQRFLPFEGFPSLPGG
jgi:hypothetical protein